MARPKTEQGFVMVALDLFAALMAADLPNREQIVLAEVLLACYGPRKAEAVYLDPPTIEQYTGLHRNNVRRAVSGLEAAGILHRNPDGSHSFVKDYDTWTPGGEPIGQRLGGGLVRFAHSALGRYKTSKRVAIQRDCETDAQAIQRDCETDAQAIQRDCVEPCPPDPPIRSAGASEDQKIKDQTSRAGGGEVRDSDDYRRKADPETTAREAGLKAIYEAAIEEFGDDGPWWYTKASQELTGDLALWLKAVRAVGEDRRVGVVVRSLPGYIRQKHRELAAGPAPELGVYGGGRKPQDDEPYYYRKVDQVALRAKVQRDREKVAAARAAEAAAAAERAAADAC
jgi:hypothetical protein